MKDKISKKPIRRYRRAGLNIPSHLIRNEVKNRLNGRRLQKNVEIVVAALVEQCTTQLLLDAAKHVKKGNYINIKHLLHAANAKDTEISNVFVKHVPGCL
jgi:S-adenosylmethionine:tRNA-ribosyltransferase-isomerase (queuine synthetase)